MNIFYYKMTNDSGVAPCVNRGLLSLAVCKPFIRKSACKGDFIFGFAASQLHADNRLIYVAVIRRQLDGHEYYNDEKYEGRVDCIYRKVGQRYVRRRNATVHSRDDLEHDLGKQSNSYPRAFVLVSSDFRYFGAGPSPDYSMFPRIVEAVHELGRGHRRNLDKVLKGEFEELKARLWDTYPAKKILGTPSTPHNPTRNYRTGPCGTVPTC